VGAAGWTWYTGSAGWMYRIWVEDVLGFQLRGNRLSIRPSVPDEWESFRITYRYGNSVWRIQVHHVKDRQANEIEFDGKRSEGPIELFDDGKEHQAEVWVSSPNWKASEASTKDESNLVQVV